MSTSTEVGAFPDKVEAQLPMLPEVGEAVGVLIGAVARAWGLPPRIDGLGDAGRAVADELFQQADSWSVLGLSVERDDLDVYVRLSADVTSDVEPTLSRATRAMVKLATGSHHVALEGTRLLIVLQAALR